MSVPPWFMPALSGRTISRTRIHRFTWMRANDRVSSGLVGLGSDPAKPVVAVAMKRETQATTRWTTGEGRQQACDP
jgi:hypothetical protein